MKHRWVSIVLWSFAVYLTPFLVVFLNYYVLGTHVFTDVAPDWLCDAFDIVYWPLVAVVGKYLIEQVAH